MSAVPSGAGRLVSAVPSGAGRLLLTLTDEEILAIDGADQGVVSLPYLDRIDATARDIARSTALRSLFARALLRYADEPHDDAGRAPGPGERVVAVAPDLAWILAVRREPDAVLAAQRIVAGRPGGAGGPHQGPDVLMRYVHAVGEEVLVEDVSPSGVHRFVAAPRSALAELMRAYLVADYGRPKDGAKDKVQEGAEEGFEGWPPEVVPARDGAAVLGGVHLVAELVVRHDDAPVRTSHTAYVYPHVAYVGAAALDDPAAAVLTRRDPATLGDWAVALLAEPARAAVGGGARESAS
ncbi:MAG: hypothetical protein IPK37_00695 [Austwickia sp.]|nr:MAG: hypothetical protein IPK37_00695 [Austwickia sp.]